MQKEIQIRKPLEQLKEVVSKLPDGSKVDITIKWFAEHGIYDCINTNTIKSIGREIAKDYREYCLIRDKKVCPENPKTPHKSSNNLCHYIKMSSFSGNGKSVELLDKSSNEHIKIMYEKCLESLTHQTDIWHTNSLKKVAACLFVPHYNEYFVSQNIGISKVTGSSCAERNAIIAAITIHPEIEKDKFTDLFILSESGTILPCGVCCEWLSKINKNMNLYTVYGDKNIVRINLQTYYGDETELERYLHQSEFN